MILPILFGDQLPWKKVACTNCKRGMNRYANQMQADRCLSSTGCKYWLDFKHSSHCCAAADFHCLLLILVVPGLYGRETACPVCGVGAVSVCPAGLIQAWEVSGVVLASPLAQHMSVSRWKRRAASNKPWGRQFP